MESELFADLCNEMGLAAEEKPDVFAADGSLPAVNPVVVALVKMWVIRQFKKLACENKADILAAVDKWITQFVSNETLAAVLSNVSVAVADSFCP